MTLSVSQLVRDGLCNAGKLTASMPLSVPGRTGTMVCTWLIDSDQFESAQVCVVCGTVHICTVHI